MENTQLIRLQKLIKRAENGEELTIAFFGGSITQGSLASKDEFSYAYRVYNWWCETFPKAHFNYVNSGIGGTSSHFGTAREISDLLIFQPDFVVVDFSVNDVANDFFKETFEGVLRRALYCNSKPAVVVLNNVFYDTGINAEEYHNAVADYYDVPYVSMKDSLYLDVKNGIYKRSDISPDGLHPNDLGHSIVAKEIEKVIKTARNTYFINESVAKKTIERNPLTENAYENAKLINITNSSPDLNGFHVDTTKKKGYLDLFRNGWIAKKVGNKIKFEIECSCLAIQYRKTINRPSPIAKAVIDEDYDNPVILDGNFKEDWGDCLFIERVLHHKAKKNHTVEIEIITATEKDKAPFYLMSLIVD